MTFLNLNKWTVCFVLNVMTVQILSRQNFFSLMMNFNGEDANRLISQSLTPELIQQQMYEKWNGQLPTVQAGSDAPIIVDTTN